MNYLSRYILDANHKPFEVSPKVCRDFFGEPSNWRIGLPEASSGDRTHNRFDEGELNICNADYNSFTIERSGFIRPDCGWDVATAINACAVVDFLHEIGIDQRGYIEKGLAVEAK